MVNAIVQSIVDSSLDYMKGKADKAKGKPFLKLAVRLAVSHKEGIVGASQAVVGDLLEKFVRGVIGAAELHRGLITLQNKS